MTVTLRGFSRSLPMALMRAREAVMAEFRPILAEYDLTEQQWRVLRALVDEPDGRGVRELARATNLLGPSVSRIVADLDKRRLVSRSRVEGDARRSRIVVTPAGIRLYESIAPRSERVYSGIEERFGRDDLELLYTLLDRLATSGTPPRS